MSAKPSLFAELKRRNVWRAAVVYIAAVWAFGQGFSQFSPALGLPDWATRAFLIAAAVGFPFWLVFAWVFEVTPHGIRRESEIAPGDSVARRTGRRLDFAIIAALAVAVILLLGNQLVWHKGMRGTVTATAAPTATASAIPAKSIAVLPFQNLSDDKKNEYFVQGMQDLILTKLADIGDLKVIARTSTESYGSHPHDLAQVGQQLGVATLLEGSVQKQGNAVLINVQLIDARSASHIWAKSYQRTLDNVFGVEGEVAGKIATALNAKLSPALSQDLAAAPTQNRVAQDAFFRAEFLAHRGDINYAGTSGLSDFKAAIPLYRQAIKADPGFALA